MPRYFDLSHPIENGMPVYPGDPGPELTPAAGMPAPWRVTSLHLGTHTGTHMDAPAHYFPGGKAIDAYPLDRLVLPGIVWDVPGLPDEGKISPEAIAGLAAAVPAGGAAILRTGWGQWWGTERYWRYPSLSAEAARYLAAGPASLVGLDTPSADPLVHTPPVIHALLLERDLLLVENLAGLDQLEAGRLYHFVFMPLLLAGLDGSPIRAGAWLPD